jgi:integrase
MDDRNPAGSAKPPATIRQPIPATSPDDIARVIGGARARSTALGLYRWAGGGHRPRRGELCGLQIRDIDLDRGAVHVAFNYVVRAGQRPRKDARPAASRHELTAAPERGLRIFLQVCAAMNQNEQKGSSSRNP